MIVERLSVDSRETAGSCPQKRVNDSFLFSYFILCIMFYVNVQKSTAVLILGKPQGVTLRLGMSHYRQPVLYYSAHCRQPLLHYSAHYRQPLLNCTSAHSASPQLQHRQHYRQHLLYCIAHNSLWHIILS